MIRFLILSTALFSLFSINLYSAVNPLDDSTKAGDKTHHRGIPGDPGGRH